jgi:hypothetical protein
MKTENSKRKYFAPSEPGKVSSPQKGYLLRWYCDKKNEVLAEGPFSIYEKAIDEQNAKLIIGICSWLVPYDG